MHPDRPVLVFAVFLAASLLPSSPAAAATIAPNVFTDDNTVNGNCTLREAIRSANENIPVDACPAGVSGADVIQLGTGTYTLTVEGSVEETATAGDLDVTEHLTITGAGRTATIIDGAWPATPDRILDLPEPDVTALFTGFTVQDGDTVAITESGAGVRVLAASTLIMEDAIIRSNEGFDGAGVTLQNTATATLRRVEVIENHATQCCAGIGHYSTADLALLDSTIARNISDGSDGGIYSGGPMTLSGVTISGNTAESLSGGVGVEGPTTMTNVTISGNRAREGAGGIYIGGDLGLNNVTITGNVADSDGDGGDGGGVHEAVESDVTMRNTIIAGNSDGSGEAPDCSGTYSSAGHNLIGATTGCAFTAGTGDLLNVDPKLGPLADNGGFTMTHALLKGSPAIGAAGPDAVATDQRGLPRKDADIGAYELVLCAKVPVNRIGTDDKDKLRGTSGPDGMLGLGGKDTLNGKGGKDGLCGGGGKDKLKGGGGKDRMKGQGGKDTCVGAGGHDKATCEREKSI